MSKLLLGKEVTAAMNASLQGRVAELKARGVSPKLAIVRCGENPSDVSYEKGATARAALVGVEVASVTLPETVSAEELIATLRALNDDAGVHGVLLFRPLPRALRAQDDAIRNAVSPEKDVDGMTDLSLAGVFEGRRDLGFPPCTAQACVEILDHYGVDVQGKRVAIVGRSMVVGRPLAMLLLSRNATVTLCHTRTQDLAEETRRADVLVSTAGALGLLGAEHVRPGQVVVDVSVNWDPEKPNARGGKGAFAGDAVFEAVEPVVEAITPVPGGVGGVTASVLMAHVVAAAERSGR